MKTLPHEIREQFQVDRMIFFSDAVFAIAITLLVIDLRIPVVAGNVTDEALLQQLVNLIPNLAGFLISFFMIGLYWTVHHRMFGMVISYTQKLLWLNLFFLLSIVIMPFTTSFYAEYGNPGLLLPYGIYVFNICFLSVTDYYLWKHICKPKNKLTIAEVSKVRRRYGVFRLMVPGVVFLASFLFSYLQPSIARIFPMAIPFVYILGNKFFWTNRLSKTSGRPTAIHDENEEEEAAN